MRRAWAVTAIAATAAVALAACGEAVPQPTHGASPTSTIAPTPSADTPLAAVEPTGATRDLATGLDSPWSVVALSNGSTLISERDTANIIELTASGEQRVVGTIDGVRHGGE